MLNDKPLILWLQEWLSDKNTTNFTIGTLDNPGWTLDVSLQGIDFKGKIFTGTLIEKSEDDWQTCGVKNGMFYGRYGPLNLIEILLCFRNWVDDTKIEKTDELYEQNKELVFLQNWYYSQCDVNCCVPESEGFDGCSWELISSLCVEKYSADQQIKTRNEMMRKSHSEKKSLCNSFLSRWKDRRRDSLDSLCFN